MLKKRQNFSLLLFKPPPPTTISETSSSTNCITPSLKTQTLTPQSDQKHSFPSLGENPLPLPLPAAGFIEPSVQQTIRRMINQSRSLTDALAAANLSFLCNVDLDLGCYGLLIRKLITLQELQLAESVYYDHIIEKGIDPDVDIVNSMVICWCKLGKIDQAKSHFDSVISDSVQCKVAINAILRELFAKERFLEAFDVVCKVKIYLGFWSYNVLVDGLCQKGYLNEAFEVFDIMLERTGSKPTLHLYKSLFYGLCKGGWVHEAESLFVEIEARGFYVDKVMYTSLIKAYCTDSKMKMAMRVYLRMLKTGCDPDGYTKNIIFHGFMKVGLFDKGLLFYNNLGQGMVPDAMTCQIMISKYCQDGRLDCASMLMKNMIDKNLTPSVHSYTVLITALYKENKLSEINNLLTDMVNRGAVIDHVLYFTVMRNRPRENALELAVLCMQAIAHHVCGCDLSSWKIECMLEEISRIDLTFANKAFGIYIYALCEVGQIETALLMFDKLSSLACKPLLFTYNSLIKYFCEDGLNEHVESLLADMECQGVVPNMSTYLIMVNTYCKRGDLDFAFDVLEKMEEKGLKPSVAIYDSLIGCLSKKGRIFDAEDIFMSMLKNGVDPDENVYMTMINGYSMNGMALEGQQLFEKMLERGIKPSSNSYTALISGLVKEKMTKIGCLYLERMLENGHEPNIVLYTSLLNSFLRNGEFNLSLRLVDLMDRNKIDQDLKLYVTLVSGISRNIYRKRWLMTDRRYEMLLHLLNRVALVPRKNISEISAKYLALELIQKVKGSNFTPNLYFYNVVIYGLCKADRMEDAYEHFESMQREGICPNEVTFTILIAKHIRIGEIDRAIHIFNEMNSYGCIPDRATYVTLLTGLCHSDRLLDAVSLLYAMRKRGLFPYRASYLRMLNRLSANNLNGPAMKLYDEMISHDYVPRQLSRD
ncbi:hypothetical protein ACFE04_000598 [Oxalis oulophora]